MNIKQLLLTGVFICSIALTVIAQTQPLNSGFENWVSIGTAENPVSWSSFNNFSSFGVPVMSFKTTDKHSGSYALRLTSQTATVPPPFGTNTLDTLAGFVFLGGADMSNPGIAYTERPLSMQAFVKGTINTGSSAYIIATLRKWNSTTHVRDQVGQALYYTNVTIANYTQISVAFNYSLPTIPDTLEIKIMAGDVGPGGFIMPGNEFFIDDISFTFPATGISEKSRNKPSIGIFPNPTSDKLTVSTLEKINSIELYNMLGERVYMINNFKQQSSYEIDLSGLKKGIYFIKMDGGEKTFTEKIVKQ